MKTKEAIEFIESRKPSNFTGRELQNVRGEKINEGKLNEVIALLKRGEAFEKMWEKFRNSYGRFYLKLIVLTPMWDIMREFKQKYFPKGGNPKQAT